MSLRTGIHQIQDRILGYLGRTAPDRSTVVRAMLQPRQGDAAGYWLQLVIAAMLATLGLALDSTAVVIGAMLIAPLMRPIVELAMGLASGSAGLVLRATVRTAASVAVATIVAIAITWLLPIHEVTRELHARTAPTLLDLVVAGTCALAAAYSTLRTDADIATTAAGTSIGISLVPPLCAAGYGLAIGDVTVAKGAALLFTANLSGILVVATFLFALIGFARVDIRAEEKAFDELGMRLGRSIRAGRAWSRLAGARLGPFARLIPPLVLVGIVFLPLQRALDQIRHRSAIRAQVSRMLGRGARRVVQYSLDQTGPEVVLRAVVVGDSHAASALEQELRAGLAAVDVLTPELSVVAVADAAAMSSLSRRLDSIPAPVVPEQPVEVVRKHSSQLVEAIKDAWPTSGTGEIVGVWSDLDQTGHVRVLHLGPVVGDAGFELLSRAVAPVEHVTLDEVALNPVAAVRADGMKWLPTAMELVTEGRRVSGLHLCVTVPVLQEPATPPARNPATPDDGSQTVRSVITAAVSPDIVTSSGETWRIVPQRAECLAPTPAGPHSE